MSFFLTASDDKQFSINLTCAERYRVPQEYLLCRFYQFLVNCSSRSKNIQPCSASLCMNRQFLCIRPTMGVFLGSTQHLDVQNYHWPLWHQIQSENKQTNQPKKKPKTKRTGTTVCQWDINSHSCQDQLKGRKTRSTWVRCRNHSDLESCSPVESISLVATS